MSRDDFETNTPADARRFEERFADDDWDYTREPEEPDIDAMLESLDPWLAAVIAAGPPPLEPWETP